MDDLGMDRFVINDFIANSAEAICVIDEAGKIEIWNSQLTHLTHIEAASAIGEDYHVIFPSLRSKSSQEALQKAFGGKPAKCRKPFKLKSILLNASFSPIRNNENDPAVLMTLQQLAIEPVNKKSRFKPLIEESPIATAIYNPCGSPKYFNKAYGAIWGAERGSSREVIEKYNIFNDDQLVELGVMPFIQKAFDGHTAEIPPIPYTPAKTHSIKHLGLTDQKFVKGHIFPIKDEDGKLEEVVIVLSDITYQKKAEQILTDTHIKFQMLTLGLPGVIYEYLVKPNGKAKFKYISEGCEEMFGVLPEEALKNESLLSDCIHPDDLESFRTSSQESDDAVKGWHWEGRIIVGGTIKWIEGKSNPAKSKNGNIIRYGMLLDITEKKITEERFKLTEERLQLALQGAEIGLWEWDTKKRKTIFNESWSKKLGYKPSELERQFEEWAELIHPEDLPKVATKLSQHLSGKTDSFEAEYRLKTKKGNYRWILDKGKAIARDAKGKVTKASGTYLDINDKKNSELLIKRNEQLFTQLFDNSPLGIVMLDEKHEVLQMNKGFENIFGYSKEEIIGNRLNNIIVPKELDVEAMNINTLTTSGKVGKLESYRLNKKGKKIPVLIYGVPVSLDNETIGIYGIYVDMTERKKAEQELKIRNSELDNFVYKVSHDLRAPLSSILGLVHLANHEENEDDIRDYIGFIEERVQQLDSFINDVLSHSKNLKLAVSVDEIDLEQVIEKCFSDLSYLPKASTIKKEVKVSGEKFYSDKWRINEIFRNLISNAIKYHNPEESHPFVKIDITTDKEQTTIVLKDNGIGMEKDTIPKVFEMFYRATEYSQGSGIGLYIVKNALEKLGGDVSLKSTPEKGTTFKITIPNSKEA
ncbi:MAG: PAS domain S-box protein [Fulvivirga sp.]